MTPAQTIDILRQLHDWLKGGTQWAPTMGAEAVEAVVEMIERAESDLATAEQDSRQKQARIERLEAALGAIAQSRNSVWQSHRAYAALEESK